MFKLPKATADVQLSLSLGFLAASKRTQVKIHLASSVPSKVVELKTTTTNTNTYLSVKIFDVGEIVSVLGEHGLALPCTLMQQRRSFSMRYDYDGDSVVFTR